MDWIRQIEAYSPINEQETQDQRVILGYARAFSHNVLLRENEIAHITSSGFIMNKSLDHVLMVHHNIRNAWAWTGGHADGEKDLLYVSTKEAKEETGIQTVTPLSEEIASVDILTVSGHIKNNQYINTHLHLSIAFILIANEEEALIVKEDENTAVSWFPLKKFTREYFDEHDVYLYSKLIQRAKAHTARASL